MTLPTRPLRTLFALAAMLHGFVLSAATYLPMSDADLALGAPVIARASVVSTRTHLEPIAGTDRPVTLVTLELLEAIKGAPGAIFVVRLPGGRVGDVVWWLPGTPGFMAGQEVVLMLGPAPGHDGQFRLTEFGLSKFDLVLDEAGRKFAVRQAFSRREDDLVISKRTPVPGGGASSRDADSFLAFLRAIVRGDESPEVAYASPVLSRSKWVNIGGREPGDCSPPDSPGSGPPCLLRWFWDTGMSASAVLTATGTQSNLRNDEPNCQLDSICDVQNAATAWHAVSATDIRLSGPTAGGNIAVTLDATTSLDGTTWTTALGCQGGTIGLGGPTQIFNAVNTYRGDTTFYAIANGGVSMRKVTCSLGYSAAIFRAAVAHEVGHVLGLGHPDDDGSAQHVAVESIHSTTSPSDWNTALMRSVLPDSNPDKPQADDIQGAQYLYGTAAVGAAPVANFSYSPSAPTTGASVTFTDTSTGGATGWNWDFGDPNSASNTSMTQSASHVFTKPQTYSVKLTAGSLNGSNSITRQVTVAAGPSNCTANTTTLCLNNGRFQTSMTFTKAGGTTTAATAVGLTSDSGYFWFFDSGNIEAVVKVLNGCSMTNPRYWVFAAGLTNVETTLTVVDTQNGTPQQYVNPQGTPFVPIQDTSAFATCP